MRMRRLTHRGSDDEAKPEYSGRQALLGLCYSPVILSSSPVASDPL